MTKDVIKVAVWMAMGSLSLWAYYKSFGMPLEAAKAYWFGLFSGVMSNFVKD